MDPEFIGEFVVAEIHEPLPVWLGLNLVLAEHVQRTQKKKNGERYFLEHAFIKFELSFLISAAKVAICMPQIVMIVTVKDARF